MAILDTEFKLQLITVYGSDGEATALLVALTEEEAVAAYKVWRAEREAKFGSLEDDPSFSHATTYTIRPLAVLGMDAVVDVVNHYAYEVQHDEEINGGDCVDWVTQTMMPTLLAWLNKFRK
jgi:hypothetical protein